MHSKFVFAVLLSASAMVAAQSSPVRPQITGVSHIAVYTSNPQAAEQFYTKTLGAVKMADPENPKGVKYAVSGTQYIEVLPLPPDAGVNRLDHVGFNTVSAEGMRKYLAVKGWDVPASVTKGSDGSRWFAVLDPEGNKVDFVQPPTHVQKVKPPTAVGHHIIHVGFLVHSRAKEDTFYRDLLGFKPYWFGGTVEGKIDWVSQQVPNGHDWLEYMLTSGPSGSGIPANISQRQLGVLDHFSIGEVSVDTAYANLKNGGRLVDVRNDGHTQTGKDGKGQFNLYDPDGVRVELMNFHATRKPCCSPFTAPDPAE